MTIQYDVEVEHEGGAELSFRTLEDRELVPNDIVRDLVRGRGYVVIDAEVLSTVDPETGLRYGRATARPVM